MTNHPSLQTASLQVTEAAIRAYAELTDDFNPIHVDAAFAAKTPMGRPIAHGTMSLCLLWQCLGKNFNAAELSALDLEVRFVKPVYIGDEVTAGGEPDAEASGLWKVWVRGQDGSDRIVGTVQLPVTES
jgi:3-hydroxybutyryl-CoA dehydratase